MASQSLLLSETARDGSSGVEGLDLAASVSVPRHSESLIRILLVHGLGEGVSVGGGGGLLILELVPQSH